MNVIIIGLLYSTEVGQGSEFPPLLPGFVMFKECSSGVGTSNFGDLKQRCLTLSKRQLYNIECLLNFGGHHLNWRF